MVTIERLGINTKWATSWQATVKSIRKMTEANDPRVVGNLEDYAAMGEIFSTGSSSVPKKGWEGTTLSAALAGYGMWRLGEFELRGIDENYFDSKLAGRVFAAVFTSEMLNLQWEKRFQEIYGGRILEGLRLKQVAYTALGVILGCKDEAFALARLQFIAHRKRYYYDMQSYPIFYFILQILADYLGEQAIVLSGTDAENEPIFQNLFKSWRSPDCEVIAPLCIAACDFHTHRCRPDDDENFYEFNNKDWTHIPVEMLLLFKLRQLSGLENPKLDHPLMNTALGILPEEIKFEPDDLIRRVRERLQQDGYSEKEIVALYEEPQFMSNHDW